MEQAPRSGRTWPVFTVPLVYVAFTGLINYGYSIDGVGPRQMLPALPFIAALVVIGAGRVLARWPMPGPAAILLRIVFGLAALAWSGVTTPTLTAQVRQWREVGTGSYSTDWWHECAILRTARDRPETPELYSNDTYALYRFTGQRSSPLPPRPWRFGILARRLQKEGQSIQVVWVHNNDRAVMPVERMLEHVTITTLAEERDGALYLIEPR